MPCPDHGNRLEAFIHTIIITLQHYRLHDVQLATPSLALCGVPRSLRGSRYPWKTACTAVVLVCLPLYAQISHVLGLGYYCERPPFLHCIVCTQSGCFGSFTTNLFVAVKLIGAVLVCLPLYAAYFTCNFGLGYYCNSKTPFSALYCMHSAVWGHLQRTYSLL